MQRYGMVLRCAINAIQGKNIVFSYEINAFTNNI